MKFRVKSTRRRMERISLNMATMIDVTFLLLAYFIFATIIIKPERRLTPNLQTQSAETTGFSDFQQQIVDVEMAGDSPVYRLAERVFQDRHDLLRALQSLPKEAGVFVRVHGHVPVEFAVGGIQVARDAGFEQVTYVPAK